MSYLCPMKPNKVEPDVLIGTLADAIAAKVKELIDSSEPTKEAYVENEYMTVKDVCDRYHISKATLYRHRNAGFLKPSLYVGRKPLFTKDDIERYLNNFNNLN